MPTTRIEIEAVNNDWHGEIEASSPLNTRRRVVNAKSFEDCINGLVAAWNEIRPDGLPTQPSAVSIEQSAAETDQGDDIADGTPVGLADAEDAITGVTQTIRRGRHSNACTCERCAAKRAA